MIRLQQIKMSVHHTQADLEKKIRRALRLHKNEPLPPYVILKRSLDARKKPDLFYVYNIGIPDGCDEPGYAPPVFEGETDRRPVVVGSGPAGLFCAYLLALSGLKPMVLERGEDVEKRSGKVEAFFSGEAALDPECNVQFGEGGAGTFSDGKLNTLVNDKAGRNRFVLETFVSFGADPCILYDAKPHLGTDVLKRIVAQMRQKIISLGGSFLFGTKLTDLTVSSDSVSGVVVTKRVSGESKTIPADTIVLAIGHSARDTFEMLHERGLLMEQKNFAVGLRIEHEQKTINRSQYGSDEVMGVGAADYKLAHQCANGRNVYTFCMCPGGYVVNASSEPGRLAVNGMGYSGRDSANANSAIIVSVDRSDFGSNHPLAGLTFQRHLEEEAYRLGNGKVPVQRYGDLACGITTTAFGHIRPLTKGDHQMSDLSKLFPEQILQAILEAIPAFGKKIAGFDDEDAILSGVESRTSSPLRILRGDDLMAGIRGIYPCGEGAGYAGGIMSAAMDGMKVAEAIILDYNENFEERNGTDKRKRT